MVTKTMCLAVNEDFIKKAKWMAKMSERSISGLIRFAVEKLVEGYKEELYLRELDKDVEAYERGELETISWEELKTKHNIK